MALRSSDSYLREEIVPANKEKHNESEGDLYFEMEYKEIKRSGSETPDSVSFSSKSVESFGSESTHDSQECCYRDGRRESSLGPILERPSYLMLTSKFKRNFSYGSLPTTSQEKIPKLGISVPATPAEPWEHESKGLRIYQSTSSTSSVEEATESVLKKTRSRLSLNLGVFDGSSSTGSPARSPRFIPKFLRSSFCKLTLKEKLKSIEPSPETKSSLNTHHKDHIGICDDNKWILNEQNLDSSPPSSTKLFVLESLAKGLPIIPFNYPTFNITENKPSQREEKSTTSEIIETPDMPDRGEQISSQSESSSRKTSRTLKQYAEKFSLEEKSLKKLLCLAKREIEEEADLKKNFSIRGYAANNSRALLRRRSSMTEYVGMSTGKDKDISKKICPISERNLTPKPLVGSFSGSGRKTKDRKLNYQKALDKSPNIDINYTKREKTKCAKRNEDYLDMSCGRKKI